MIDDRGDTEETDEPKHYKDVVGELIDSLFALKKKTSVRQDALMEDTIGLLNGMALGTGLSTGNRRIRDNLIEVLDLLEEPRTEKNKSFVEGIMEAIFLASSYGLTVDGFDPEMDLKQWQARTQTASRS